MYQVLARKWRPQTFEQLVGQQHVAATLANAIESDRLAHAYIFAGLRGTGKTSAARILAKSLNCERGPTPRPCNECTSCTEIAESRSLDVMEMDAASRTGVDDIRELQEIVSYAPVRDRYRLLIIDEAHMLSKNAFNALLKTLEEPPPWVVFILATTQLQKLLPTVLSRCQVFEFRRVSPREVVEHLRALCGEERIEISDVSLERIARAGEGSVRDSLSVLERVLAFCGNSIQDEDVLRVLGAVRNEVLAEMVAALSRRDAAGMLAVLDGLADEGHDLVHFWNELIAVLRDLLLLRAAPGRTELLARPAAEAEPLAAAAEGLSQEDLTRAFQILADLEPGLKSSSQPRYLFEATLVRLASLGAVRPIEQVLAALGGEPLAPTGPAPRGRTAAPRPSQKKNPAEPVGLAPGDLAADFRAAVQRSKPMLDAILEQASEVRLEGRTLVVAFPAANSALRRQLERDENLTALRECAGRIAGEGIEVLISTAPDTPPRPAQPSATPERPAGDAQKAPAAAETAREPLGRQRGRLLKQARNEPGINRLLREFGAQVVDIRPLAAKGKEDPEDS